MRTPPIPFVVLPLLALLACGGGDTADWAAPAAEAVHRTADPYKRGYIDADFPRVQELAPGVYSYEQLRSAGEEKFTTVSLFVVTPEGVLVADGQGNVEETQRLVETIAGITDRPITHVVIGSDHGDHTGGNSAFPAGVAIIAHPTSAAALQAMANRPNRPAGSPPVPLATELVEDRSVLNLGGTEIQILHLGRAHTGGDLVVYLPVGKVLFMSETYLNRVFPAMRSAHPTEWVAMIERAQAMDVEIYVPGHGFVDSPAVLREELEAYRQATLAIIAEVTRLHAASVPVEDAVEQARFGEFDTWELKDGQVPIAVRRIYAELDGELR